MLHSKPHLFIAIKLWLICWLITGNAYSQSPVYKNYTVNDGLPSQVVYCALQDKEGYMWFGTDAGVSRFDGRHFENFTSNDGLSDNEVLKVFEDSSHRIWFLMANGTISYYLHGKICNSLNEVSLKNVKARRELMSFFEDHDHNLWFGSSGGQLVFLPRKGQSRVLDMDSQKLQGSNSLVYAFQDNMEMMLIVGSSLYSMKDFHLSLIDTTCYINRTTVYVVKEALDSVSTAISFKNGIGEMKDGKISMLLRKEEIPHYELVQRMVIDKEGGIWLFSSNLTTSFFKVSNTGYHQKSYLEGIYVASVFIDNEGSKWFCTVGNGIFKLTKYDDQITLFQGSSFNKEVWSVNIDSKDGIWFGNGTRTLYRIINDSIDLAVDLGNEQYKNGRITRIDFDYLGNVWCTLGNGIVCLRIDAEKKAKIEEVRTIHNLRFFNAKYFRFDRYNQPFFSSNKGIQKIYQVNGKYVFDIYVPEFLDPFAKVFCLYFDNKNCLWYEKFNTLISYDGRKVKKYSELTNQFKSQISSIEGFQDSILVIATYGNGIQFFRDGKII
ncbi:MAG TPA: two-component regulator propeller domain-containing protein, partial [Chitinophagales bacterium]|nr:two-component regulator propeller domain-containing protein [Chitinophagales bacterium]